MASKTKLAKLLAVLVLDTNETELTIPFGEIEGILGAVEEAMCQFIDCWGRPAAADKEGDKHVVKDQFRSDLRAGKVTAPAVPDPGAQALASIASAGHDNFDTYAMAAAKNSWQNADVANICAGGALRTDVQSCQRKLAKGCSVDMHGEAPSKHFVHAAISPPLFVDWMARVERPAIEAHIRAKPADLDKPLRRVVATFAEAHERAEPEFVDVAVMRINMIADCRRLDDAPL